MFELYSKRILNKQGEPDVYIYDEFPENFRNQVFYTLSDVLDFYQNKGTDGVWNYLHDTFAREVGLKTLYEYYLNKRTQIEHFITNANDQSFLDFLDYSFNLISRLKSAPPKNISFSKEHINVIDTAINQLNFRLKQHNLGYEFINEAIIRKDNQLLHQETIKPALKLLVENGFDGPENEFFNAFEHRRKGNNKDAILYALKAFESTMKAICNGCNYTYDSSKASAKELISILQKNSFYPEYLNNHISGLRNTLENGLPTVRNKTSGHGQGETVVNVSDEFAEYALNLAATNIVLLVKIFYKKKS